MIKTKQYTRTYEYRTVEIKWTGQETENMLNALSYDGWEVVCSYAHEGRWLILRRKI